MAAVPTILTRYPLYSILIQIWNSVKRRCVFAEIKDAVILEVLQDDANIHLLLDVRVSLDQVLGLIGLAKAPPPLCPVNICHQTPQHST